MHLDSKRQQLRTLSRAQEVNEALNIRCLQYLAEQNINRKIASGGWWIQMRKDLVAVFPPGHLDGDCLYDDGAVHSSSKGSKYRI